MLLSIWRSQLYATVAARPATEPTPGGAWAASTPDVFIASDSDGFVTRKVGIGLYPWYENGDRHTGLQVQRNTYAQGGWRAQGEELSIVHRAINPRDALGYQLKAGIHRDRVDTQEGLRDGLHLTSAGAGP